MRTIVGDLVVAVDVLAAPNQHALLGDADGDLMGLLVHTLSI